MPVKTILKNSKIFICGEYPTKDEELLQIPFQNVYGKELAAACIDAGIDLYATSRGYLLPNSPLYDKFENLFVKKKEAGYNFPPPVAQGKYLHPELISSRQELYASIEASGANLVLALGGLAAWALLDKANIKAIRGTIFSSPYISAKVLPSYSPKAFTANWALRHILVADLFKASRECKTKVISYDEAKVIIEPSLGDLSQFYSLASKANILSFDIETLPAFQHIRCVGFCIPNGEEMLSLVIPLTDFRKSHRSYWENPNDEIIAINCIKALLQLPMQKVTQNGLYDIYWLLDKLGITPAGELEDTMLLHHSMFPEMEKGLAFFGSIYTSMPAWKNSYHDTAANKKES